MHKSLIEQVYAGFYRKHNQDGIRSRSECRVDARRGTGWVLGEHWVWLYVLVMLLPCRHSAAVYVLTILGAYSRRAVSAQAGAAVFMARDSAAETLSCRPTYLHTIHGAGGNW